VSAEPVIVHEESEWVVLNKPAGWHSVGPGKRRTSDGPDVEAWLRARFEWAGALEEGGLVHRLDRDTSGCLAAAKSGAAVASLRDEFRSERVRKTYLALVEPGIAGRGEFRLYFTSRHTRSMKMMVREVGEAKHAGCCRWRVVARAGVADAVEVDLVGPGRRHQIRAGFAHLGHPILGDTLYGGAAWTSGLGLHAWRLTIGRAEATCPPPEHWPPIPLKGATE